MPKLFIAAGHGGTDPGAVSSPHIERDIAIAVVDKAFQLCLTQNKGVFELVKVPHSLGLVEGIHWINANMTDWANDMCVEVHLNSNAGTPGTGTETYHGNIPLAREIHEEVVKVLQLRDRGLKDGNMFMFNNSTKCASALTELGFINNPNDAVVVIQRGGLALAKAMIRACNSTWKDPVVTPPVVVPPVVKPPVVVPPVVTPPVVTPPTDTALDKDTNAKVNLIWAGIQWLIEQWKKIFK